MSSRDDVRRAVESAVASVLARLKGELVDGVVASIPEPPPAPAPAPAAAPAPEVGAGGGADLAALRAETFVLFDGNGQVEILNRLMDSIATWWDRSALFLVKGTSFQPWDARGFEGGKGNAAVKALVLQEGSDTLLDAALSGSGAQAGNHLLEGGLGPHRGARAAVPLAIRNKAAAILYVDGPRHDDASSVAALEILARVGAGAIELGMLTKRTPPFVRCEAALAPSPTPSAPTSVIAAMPEPEPEIEPEMEVDVEVTPTFTAPAPTFTPPAPAPTFTPPAPAPTFMPPPSAPAAQAPPPPARPAEAPAPVPASADPGDGGTMDPRELLKGGAKPVVDAGQALSSSKTFSRWKPVRDQVKSGDEVDPTLAAIPEAERPKHVEARKIARLLVSEIKLYNEAKVAVGRKNRDLYERLKDDIERSRATYNERIDPKVASSTNYFRDELVTTLGEGDAGSLGAGLR